MEVLVINVGSTSVKYDLFDMEREVRIAHGAAESAGSRAATERAIAGVAASLRDRRIGAVGHRVAHGGGRLVQPVRIDAAVESTIAELAELAPLHNPLNLLGIRAARAAFPEVPHVAVFDTAFHAAMPERSFLYGVPYELYLERGVRRFGFHGPSHQFMTTCAAEVLGADPGRLRLVTCHLGGGSSIAAIRGGVSIDTSMGMTPLEGVVMGTRPGDLDPGVPLQLLRWGISVDEIDRMFNQRSGLAGISGLGGDFRAIEAAAERGHARARLAVDMFVQRIQRYIGGYAAELGGVDAVVFAGGIGEGSWRVRERVCANLGFLGVALDAERNRGELGGATDVSAPEARTRVVVVHTEEDRVIAREVVRCLG